MNIFGISEAKHYCSLFVGSIGDSEKSIKEFQKNRLGSRYRTLTEGSTLFNEYRDCSLRNVERALFFAASHYRRTLELMIPSSSPWAQVTLYYGSWYVSHALLGLFGCTIFDDCVIDVDKGSPSHQVLRLRKIGDQSGQVNTTYKGSSHRRFWDFFYRALHGLKSMVPAQYSVALAPISSNPIWQIQKRNDVNYDSFTSLILAEDFGRCFSGTGFPNCLPGILKTQFRILELLLELTFSYTDSFGLATDALNRLSSPSSLRGRVGRLIYNKKPPGLVQKTKKSAIT